MAYERAVDREERAADAYARLLRLARRSPAIVMALPPRVFAYHNW
jgi:hypothetical protein